jgi:hypothetical protein
MEIAKKLIDQIDSIKEKLSDKEYKEIADTLLEISKTNNQLYEITVFAPYPKLQVCPFYDDSEGVEKVEHHYIDIKPQKIRFKSRLLKCTCYGCTHNTDHCRYQDFYKANGEPCIINKGELESLVESNFETHEFFNEDCDCCGGFVSIDIPNEDNIVNDIKIGGTGYCIVSVKKV